MEFFRTVLKSVYDPAFYREVAERSAGEAFRYFAKFVSLVSLVAVVVPIVFAVGVFVWGRGGEHVETVRQQVRDIFPQELVVRFEHGTVSTNVPEPYMVALPKPWQGKESYDGQPLENLLVINTGKSIEASDFRELKTFAILGKTQVGVLNEDRGKIEIQDLSGLEKQNYTIDKTLFSGFLEVAWKWIKIIGVILLIILPFVISVVMLAWYSLYLLFGALAIWLAAKIRNRALTYGQSYKLGFYLLTGPVILSFLLVPLFQIPLFFTAILFAFALMNFVESVPSIETPDHPKSDEAIELPASQSSTTTDSAEPKPSNKS